ncbi:MAG: bifunctional pyr operon transcriptional regulator/uracil phosphoribosyltransferase PyrR [Flavobacteriia bacterium]|nr:bifunctional pyr operon transcriptional regulator/uracil phosphoribosyltransferase PyrR [Flavobacteriia bacterium]
MERQILLSPLLFNHTIERLSHELIEKHNDFSDSILIGLQPRGVHLLTRLKYIFNTVHQQEIQCGVLDITFYRDDFRRREKPLIPSVTNIDFIVENKKVILVDDVLFTGRTIRSGMDALLAFGRPKSIELLVLIDRRFTRELPIQADFVGRTIDTLTSERVSVEWKDIEGKDQVLLYTPSE